MTTPATITTTILGPGRYAVTVTPPDGRWVRFTVARREVSNPSPRGGAYRIEWQARTSGRTMARADTLRAVIDALPAVVDRMRSGD